MSVVPIRYAPDEDEPVYSLEFLHPRYNPGWRYHLPNLQTLSQFEKCRRSLQRPSRQDDSGLHMRHITKDGFCVNLDVEQFDPNEITVRTVDNHIIVEARDYAKENGDFYFNRRFVGRYTLPKEFDIKDLVATLTPNGILSIKVPTKGTASVSSKTQPEYHTEINEYELDEDERG